MKFYPKKHTFWIFNNSILARYLKKKWKQNRFECPKWGEKMCYSTTRIIVYWTKNFNEIVPIVYGNLPKRWVTYYTLPTPLIRNESIRKRKKKKANRLRGKLKKVFYLSAIKRRNEKKRRKSSLIISDLSTQRICYKIWSEA